MKNLYHGKEVQEILEKQPIIRRKNLVNKLKIIGTLALVLGSWIWASNSDYQPELMEKESNREYSTMIIHSQDSSADSSKINYRGK